MLPVDWALKKERESSTMIIIGPLPPPTTGSTKNTRIITDEVMRLSNKPIFSLNSAPFRTSAHSKSTLYIIRKIIRFIDIFRTIFYARWVGERDAYMVPDGGRGIYFSMIYALLMRMLGIKLMLHHRNYSHIYNPTLAMAIITRCQRKDAVHVFLDAEMADAFDAAYRVRTQRFILSNAAMMDMALERDDLKPVLDDAPIVVGFLSNLSFDKGFDIVVESFLRLSKLSTQYRFMLAGPATTPADADRLARLREQLGTRLDYQGSVFGPEKARFYHQIDFFLFPTRHRQEAQPNVLFEAMAVGAIIIASRRAGIPAMLEGLPSFLVDEKPNQVDQIVSAISGTVATPGWRQQHQVIRDAFAKLRREAQLQYCVFLEMLVSNANDR